MSKTQQWSRTAWALVLVSLPVSSFRYLPFLGKETAVRPLAFFPLLPLLLLLAWRLVRREIRFPWSGPLLLLGLFMAVSLVGTAWGWTYGQVPMHGQDYTGRAVRAWITLAGGLAFLASVLLMNQSEQDLQFTLKWMYAGLAVSLVVGLVEVCSYLTGFPTPASINSLLLSFSTRPLQDNFRITGVAYEPSWLANQIVTSYLPWLLAAALTSYRVFRRRWIEWVMLGGGLALLLSTFSRGGILIAAGTIAVTFLLTQRRRMRLAWEWLLRPFTPRHLERRLTAVMLRLGLLLAAAGILAGVGLALSSNDYFSKLWRSRETSLVDYVVDIYAGPRLAYAAASWETYLDHPLTGVGLGAAGLSLYYHLPDWSVTIVSEISRQLAPDATLYPNPKNLYVRLLAEAGLPGFFLYLLFWLNVLSLVLRLFKHGGLLPEFLGVAGIFLWIALILFNMTQDSLIDPNQWLSLGIVLGMSSGVLAKTGLSAGIQPAGRGNR